MEPNQPLFGIMQLEDTKLQKPHRSRLFPEPVFFFRTGLLDQEYKNPLTTCQFVLPQWMELLPCPPQVEMMDTTLLFACIASLPKITWAPGTE
ncbi:unnamed protein product [Thlaspi arvense]|uniref:Uncharacterized protein n=1 Tax=Thlaspi arvense TaxID=13288 RepID=A0AAU9T802_THLAR|nr:unnamed protein product [Thlaspi arvense]